MNYGCKRWRNGRGNVTAEELESSLNLVCISLSQSMHLPVIGFRFTHHSLCDTWVMELAALTVVCMSAGLYLNVSFSLRMQMSQERVVMERFCTCISCFFCIRIL